MDARGGRATSVAGRCENGHSFDRAETAADGVGDRHPQEQAKGRRSDRPEPTRAAIDARTTRRRMGKSGRCLLFQKRLKACSAKVGSNDAVAGTIHVIASPMRALPRRWPRCEFTVKHWR